MSISTSGAAETIENSACEWEEGDPQLYMLQHTKKHPKGMIQHAVQGRTPTAAGQPLAAGRTVRSREPVATMIAVIER